MNKRLIAFNRLALSTLASLVVLHSAVSYADDTEIFFGGPAIDDSVRPNVLFILDNSGSMAWRTDSNSNPSGSQKSRMQVLKDSFADIINNAGAINAGIMVLNSRGEYDNTRMVYPVTNIDAELPTSAQVVASTPRIEVSGDDATQRVAPTLQNADISSSSLTMGALSVATQIPGTNSKTLPNNGSFFLTGSGYSCALAPASLAPPAGRPSTQCGNNSALSTLNLRDSSAGSTALLQIPAVNHPANYTITSAYLELTPTNNRSYNQRPTLDIAIQRSKTPAALNDSNLFGPGRTFINSSTRASSWQSGQTAQFDITNSLKDLLDDDADPIGDMIIAFRAQENRDYFFSAQGASASVMPRIVINYSAPSSQVEERMGALRFQNVGIPRGATIETAVLSFTPAASNSDPVTFSVKAESTDDANVFTASNLSARGKTSATVNWSAPEWINDSPPVAVAGPNVLPLVQEVVNRSNWCGNNSMAFYLTPNLQPGETGSRIAHSIDGAPGLQPTLTVTYSGGSGGCLNPIIEASITNPKNDAFEYSNGSMALGDNTLPIDRSRIGARYEGMPINKGATILDAQVILTPANTVTAPNTSSTVRFESADNAAPFTTNTSDITDRGDEANSTCAITEWSAGIPVICNGSQLRSGLQNIVNRSGWQPGNAVSIMAVQSSDTNLDVQAYESNPAQSIKLRIKLASGGLSNSANTVRKHLNSLVQSMTANNGTPIVPTMNEAARYLRGTRSGYASPITSACQSTHLVVLTDGQANGNGAQSSIGSLIGSSCSGDASDSNEQCGRSLATWMANIDQSGITGDNFITTHTIGFALNSLAPNTQPQTFLSALANNGKGKAYTAENASELSAAFSQILQDVLSTDTTFVSPGATVNQFNRQSNKNEVYFALFKPSETNRWVGNLKRYALGSGADIIVDADNVGAIDAGTGFFKNTSRSFWTPVADGNNTAQGGAANRLPTYTNRKAYTYIGNTSPTSPANLTDSAYLLKDTNLAITPDKLGLNILDVAGKNTLINWIRGLNDDGSARKAMGDPLHSVPRLVTYKCNTFTDSTYTNCASEEQSAFIGTNEGFVHAFNTNTGDEQMAFMPQELLRNINELKANERSTTAVPRAYGMDNTVALWVNDLNGNGVIYGGKNPTASPPALLSGLNTDEFVYAYATMGRGGRNLYSLDVTDTSSPKLRWFITPSTPGFSRLGQTWSTPVVTTININGTKTKVIMFAGGYDEGQDDVSILDQDKFGNPRTESYGNAIYIVNATTGALIWSGSNQATNTGAQAHQQLTKMRYSMPSSLRAIDIDRDGVADQFFVGDMGGQVWRFFIQNGNPASSLISPLDSASGTTGDGIFASVIPADTGSETATQKKAKLRRFYNEPDIALLTVNTGKALVVNIGSGYRGHPLDTGTEDRFYSFRTPIIANNDSHTILTESAMYDATLNLVQEGTATQKAAAGTAFSSNTGGWYIRMENSGEKVLSEATTFAGQIFFNTYEPNSNSANNSCKAVQGTGRSYAVNLFDATPPIQRITGSPDRSDRSIILNTAGIPPKDVLLFGEDREKATKCTGTECEDLDVDTTVGPTYWIDEL